MAHCHLNAQSPSTYLRQWLTQTDSASASAPASLKIGNLTYHPQLNAFYQLYQYQVVWSSLKNSNDLISIIHNATDDGLDPADYQLAWIERYKLHKNIYEAAVFDLLLTNAFLNFSQHLVAGRHDPVKLYPGKWQADCPSLDLLQWLIDALQEQNIIGAINQLRPNFDGYSGLRQQLQKYMSLKREGGWQAIPYGPTLEPGMTDNRIPMIRRRLQVTDHLKSGSTNQEEAYDSLLVEAVKKFQRQHGLMDDGIIGKYTLEALNFPVDYYINKLKINMERYRWLPENFERKGIQVNIPAFRAEVRGQEGIQFSTPVIVGRIDRMTPVFSSTITHVTHNPTWTVPPTILKEDMLPAIARDISYLHRNHIRVFDHAGAEIFPDSLPWSSYTVKNFPFILRQDPGVFNALGLIKFESTNIYSVYLHDTNQKSLFNRQERAMSSGCIRIENPFDVALYLLKDTDWTPEKFQEKIDEGKTGYIRLEDPFPLHVVYFTAFVDSSGALQFRKDIYGWDDCLMDASKCIH